MHILPLPTALLRSGSDLAEELMQSGRINGGDIIVISSKAMATIEGGTIDLLPIAPSAEASAIAKKTGQDPRFVQAIIHELTRLDGTIVRTLPGVILTEVHPKGMQGSILVANAGLDRSNAGENAVVGWPVDPAASAKKLRRAIEEKVGGKIAVIVSDSSCTPRRRGVTAIALAVSGIEPIRTQKGEHDLFGRALLLTDEAVADQLATGANAVMGNAAQSTPGAVIRDHGIAFAEYEGWVPGIERDEDLFG